MRERERESWFIEREEGGREGGRERDGSEGDRYRERVRWRREEGVETEKEKGGGGERERERDGHLITERVLLHPCHRHTGSPLPIEPRTHRMLQLGSCRLTIVSSQGYGRLLWVGMRSFLYYQAGRGGGMCTIGSTSWFNKSTGNEI